MSIPIKKCIIRKNKAKKCSEIVIASVKAQVIHQPSNRITLQKWNICETHLHQLSSTEIRSWRRWYHGKRQESNIINFKVESIDEITNFTFKPILNSNSRIKNL